MTKTHHILASLLVIGVALAVGAAPAMAEHKLDSGIPPFGSGHFVGVAVDQQTGNVYLHNYGSEAGGPLKTNHMRSTCSVPTADPRPVGFPRNFLVHDAGPVAVDNACYFQKLSGSACTTFDSSNGDVYVAPSGGQHEILKLALNTNHEYEVVAVLTSPVGANITDIAVDDQGTCTPPARRNTPQSSSSTRRAKKCPKSNSTRSNGWVT